MTATKYTLNAQKRTVTGKKVKALRKARILPAHIFGNTEPVNVQFEEKAFMNVFNKAGETSVLYITIEGEKEERPVLVADYTVDPLKGAMTHVDLRQVNLNVKVTANVPVEIVGESEAVKAGGVLTTSLNEIEVEALPNDLPEKFELDISKLVKIGDTLKVADLDYDKSKVMMELDPEEVLVIVNEPVVEVEEPVAAAEPAEVELTKQGATKEVEEGAEVGKGGAAAKPAEKKEEK